MDSVVEVCAFYSPTSKDCLYYVVSHPAAEWILDGAVAREGAPFCLELFPAEDNWVRDVGGTPRRQNYAVIDTPHFK